MIETEGGNRQPPPLGTTPRAGAEVRRCGM